MSSRTERLRKMQDKLEEWNAEIDRLTAKADEVTADVQHECDRQIDSLKAKQAATRQKIEEIQHAGGNALEDLKSGVALSLTAMGEALDSARSRFR